MMSVRGSRAAQWLLKFARASFSCLLHHCRCCYTLLLCAQNDIYRVDSASKVRCSSLQIERNARKRKQRRYVFVFACIFPSLARCSCSRTTGVSCRAGQKEFVASRSRKRPPRHSCTMQSCCLPACLPLTTLSFRCLPS